MGRHGRRGGHGRRGKSRPGRACPGAGGMAWRSRHGVERRVLAWRHLAWQAGRGRAGLDKAWQGVALQVTNYISMGYMIISWRGPHGAGYTYEESNVVDTLLPLNAHDPKEIAHV